LPDFMKDMLKEV